jgi:transposase-like protein
MNIIQRGERFVQGLREMASRSVWDWRRCPYCKGTETCNWGSYRRRPYTLQGRQELCVPRHRCRSCKRTYSEQSPWLVRRSWYARDVHRCAVDLWQHTGTSLRRGAEWVRSLIGRQERWQLWHVLSDPVPAEEQCHLAASTVHRWLDRAGREAQKTVPGQLEGISTSGRMGVDGLWARLRGGGKRVVLALVDNVSGLLWPPVVVAEEESEGSWCQLLERAVLAGLDLDALRGVVSDGANGLIGCLQRMVKWANHQRCVFHLWRNLAGELSRQVAAPAKGLVGAAAKAVRRRVRRELVALIHAVLDARSQAEAELALAKLQAHQSGTELARLLENNLDAALVHLNHYNQGLLRVGPEWLWRDFRLRISRGRNHATDARLERAALVWAIYRNLTPAQWRSERKRHYRRPGQSPLEMAGVPPGDISYLDALAV